MDTKGHVLVKVKETDEYITWQCVNCMIEISFSKIYEPKTDGELPENVGDYLDRCVNNYA